MTDSIIFGTKNLHTSFSIISSFFCTMSYKSVHSLIPVQLSSCIFLHSFALSTQHWTISSSGKQCCLWSCFCNYYTGCWNILLLLHSLITKAHSFSRINLSDLFLQEDFLNFLALVRRPIYMQLFHHNTYCILLVFYFSLYYYIVETRSRWHIQNLP